MVIISSVFASALAIGSWAGLGAATPVESRGAPVGEIATPIEARGGAGGEIALALASIIKGILGWAKEGSSLDPVFTYDFKTYPQFCDLYMETRDGGHCYATVECKEGGKMFYKKDFELWDQCYVGGTTRFDDPRIGEFEIQFRTRDGFEGQGLTEPIFRLKEFQNWKTWDATALAIEKDNTYNCEKGLTPLNCNPGPFLCHFVTSGIANPQDGRVRRWSCGVPIKGDKSLDKMPGVHWPYLENGIMKDGYHP